MEQRGRIIAYLQMIELYSDRNSIIMSDHFIIKVNWSIFNLFKNHMFLVLLIMATVIKFVKPFVELILIINRDCALLYHFQLSNFL